jgi:hypothetical protein
MFFQLSFTFIFQLRATENKVGELRHKGNLLGRCWLVHNSVERLAVNPGDKGRAGAAGIALPEQG